LYKLFRQYERFPTIESRLTDDRILFPSFFLLFSSFSFSDARARSYCTKQYLTAANLEELESGWSADFVDADGEGFNDAEAVDGDDMDVFYGANDEDDENESENRSKSVAFASGKDGNNNNTKADPLNVQLFYGSERSSPGRRRRRAFGQVGNDDDDDDDDDTSVAMMPPPPPPTAPGTSVL